jgi:hypothetical protein
MSEPTNNPPPPLPPTTDYASPATPRPGRVIHHAEMPEEHPERHEHTDVSVRGIWITVGAVLLVTAIVHVIMYVVFFAYEGAQAAEDRADRRSVENVRQDEKGPPGEIPRLQGIQGFNAETPSEDLLKMRQENRAVTARYGKTADGRVHIPIDRALELSLQEQQHKALFPSRAPATQPAGGARAGQ